MMFWLIDFFEKLLGLDKPQMIHVDPFWPAIDANVVLHHIPRHQHGIITNQRIIATVERINEKLELVRIVLTDREHTDFSLYARINNPDLIDYYQTAVIRRIKAGLCFDTEQQNMDASEDALDAIFESVSQQLLFK